MIPPNIGAAQYIQWNSQNPEINAGPNVLAGFTDAPVSVTGNSGAKITATRKVTHFSANGTNGGPTIPAVILAANVGARLGFFNKNGHFHHLTDASVGA